MVIYIAVMDFAGSGSCEITRAICVGKSIHCIAGSRGDGAVIGPRNVLLTCPPARRYCTR